MSGWMSVFSICRHFALRPPRRGRPGRSGTQYRGRFPRRFGSMPVRDSQPRLAGSAPSDKGPMRTMPEGPSPAAGNGGGTAAPRSPRRASAGRSAGGAATLSRGELYAEVWSVLMLRLGSKYGLSDVGLAKVRRKHDIPLPPRGYWARKQHGKAVKQSRLPSPERNPSIEIRPYRAGTQMHDEQVR